MFRSSRIAIAVFCWLMGGALCMSAAPQNSSAAQNSTEKQQSPQEQPSTPPAPQPAQPAQKLPDAFFAGTVTEIAPDHIAVARVAQGKMQKRVFRVLPETKVEGQGRLRLKVRVTVRYQMRDEGDTATMIIVRMPPKRRKK
ncbi:MAG TPA: hypothetical protein VFW83_07490 [Bryobacteraceae bacterium]|nr:hypothetical protein [Bryobacteraceae bacterium]